MRYEIVVAPEAAESHNALPAYRRAEVRDALERHLRYEPTRGAKSRIKRLRALSSYSIASGWRDESFPMA